MGLSKMNPNKPELKKFGITMGLVLLSIALLILLRHKAIATAILIISAVFLLLAFIRASVLKPVDFFWMKLAFILAWLNVKLLLFILFYLIFAPIGILMRLLKIDLLDRKIDKNKSSYWIKKEKEQFKQADYERRF